MEFVANALSPAKVLRVIVNEEQKATTVIVPDYQLSLAIGKRGQNARLAAKLTGWKIDIKSESEAREMGIDPHAPSTSLDFSDAAADNENSEENGPSFDQSAEIE
ncbi:hypothetical protein LR69_01839 [Geobacillus sp. BCO2]|nr:hypothetical protein LR69_01839 [Geobacillus sp. BCO2]